MNEMKQTIPVFFTIDDGYAPWLSAALQSLIANASQDYHYDIVILHQELQKENRQRLASAAVGKDAFTIRFVSMQAVQERMENITDRMENRLHCDYFTLTIYFRLFIPEMFPEYDKGIYIDSDIIVPGDISKMYNINLGDNLIGACPDHSVVDIPELAHYMEGAVGVDRYQYINSGVLLMNLKKLREIHFSEQFLYLLNTYHFDCIAPDQDYLNAMCNGKILYLDECWDAMPNDKKPPLKNPQLIHYNLFDKPWCYDNIQYEEYFWKYAAQTPYYKEIVDFKNSYSQKQVQSDRKCLSDLIQKADAMPLADVTFRKIKAGGERIRV